MNLGAEDSWNTFMDTMSDVINKMIPRKSAVSIRNPGWLKKRSKTKSRYFWKKCQQMNQEHYADNEIFEQLIIIARKEMQAKRQMFRLLKIMKLS